MQLWLHYKGYLCVIIFVFMPVVQEIMLYNGNSNLVLVAISFTRAETYLQFLVECIMMMYTGGSNENIKVHFI